MHCYICGGSDLESKIAAAVYRLSTYVQVHSPFSTFVSDKYRLLRVNLGDLKV